MMSLWGVLIVAVVVLSLSTANIVFDDGGGRKRKLNEFPKGFYFASASAAYQVEGAWNVSGKGESIWDRYTHETPSKILDGSNGDVAADSYHLYQEDVKALKEMGMHFYRFSLSWPRLLPTGYIDKINPDGVRYYNELINALIKNRITPLVTLYHWDLPQPLQDLGGWPNEALVEYFVDYANVAFKLFGDRVKWWITFNEPGIVSYGYSDGPVFAPGLNAHGIADYLAAHIIIKAHARAYRLYDKYYRDTQKGKVSIALQCAWFEPLNSSSQADIDASNRAMQFDLGWFMHPIFSESGDYPKVMKDLVKANSERENRVRSRLPTFSKEEIQYIRGTCDFLSLVHYTTCLATSGEVGEYPSRERDKNVIITQDERWEVGASPWLKVVPWGFRKHLNWIKEEYDNPTIFIVENGISNFGELNDNLRIKYFASYLSELLMAINQDKCNVIGYTAWSLIDTFEWIFGYKVKYGFYHVDFNDTKRPRTPRRSSHLMSEIIRTNSVPERFFKKEDRSAVGEYKIGNFTAASIHRYLYT